MDTLSPPIPANVDSLKKLDEEWGRRPFCQERYWVDISTLKLDVPDLEVTLRKLPQEKVYVRAMGDGADAGVRPRLPFDARPLAEQISGQSVHVVALNLQDHDPAYAEVLQRFVDLVRPAYEKRGHRLVSPTIGIFLAAGKSIVPFHADLEHNFLMHIYGDKWLHVFPNTDWEMLPATAREKMAVDTGAGRFLEYKPHFESRGQIFHFRAGVSGYQPPYCPHWVENGPNVTLSLLLSVYTSAEVDLRMNHMCNHGLRKLGIKPAQVGQRPMCDAVKTQAAYAMRGAMRTVRRLRGQPVGD